MSRRLSLSRLKYICQYSYRLRLLLLLPLLLFSTGCTRLFFYPMAQHVNVPSAFGFDYQDIFLSASDGTRLHAWLIEPKGPPLGTVYFLHGNAENVSTHFRATLWLAKQGYEVFALDYRGYGLSSGKPDVPEVFDDIEAGAQWIQRYRAKADTHTPVYLYGQSLGASLAITFTARYKDFNREFNGLISEAAFSRFDLIAKDVASRHWLTWSAQYPTLWLITRHHDPLDAIAHIHDTPKLLIHSPEDAVIPYHFGESLFAEAKPPKQWLEASGPHIRAAADPAIREAILAFMQRFAFRENEPALPLSGNQTNP